MSALLEIREKTWKRAKPSLPDAEDGAVASRAVSARGSAGRAAALARCESLDQGPSDGGPPGLYERLQTDSPLGAEHPTTLRIGLLGLGGVGRALIGAERRARQELRDRGVELRFTGALVRDGRRYRGPLPAGLLLTDAAEEFFLRRYDVVIEVMGGVEPAGTLVREALRHGAAVVTANKTLMAEQGPELRRLARRRGVPLLYEAAVIAGVPFLSALRGRPLASRVERISAILNGTSNYILTRLGRDGVSFAEAVRDAQRKGYAEPDPSSDVGGHDAAQKLAVLLQEFAGSDATPARFEVRGIDALAADDLRAARRFGGAIKPVAHADVDRATGRVAAFVGPAFVPQSHRLANIEGCDTGLLLRGSYAPELFFAGPGAGCDVTAATILDDVVELAAHGARRIPRQAEASASQQNAVVAPRTGWFVRVEFGGAAQGRRGGATPGIDSICQFLASHAIWPRRVEASPTDVSTLYLLTGESSRERIEVALSALAETTGCRTAHFRVLENGK